MHRRSFVLAFFATATTVVLPKEAQARRRRRRRGIQSFGSARGTTSGECPCNGGKVCIGPRGGRYCITRGGNKRYGV